MFDAQRSRGTQGFGIFDGRHTVKAAMEKRMKRWFKRKDNKTDMLLFHHRYPTSTVNEKRAAHPFNTGGYFGDTRYVLVHNGVIRNAKARKEEHEKLGIEYQSILHDGTWNDSEALLWDIALKLEGKSDKVEAYGDIAFTCIKTVKGIPERMYFGRNHGRPLKLQRDEQFMKLSSEVGKDAEATDVGVHTLYNYNYKLKRLSHSEFRIPAYDETNWNKDWNTNYGNNYCGTGQLPAYSGAGTSFNLGNGNWDDYDEMAYDYWDRRAAQEEEVIYYSDEGFAFSSYEDAIVTNTNGIKEVWDEYDQRWVKLHTEDPTIPKKPFTPAQTGVLIKDIVGIQSPVTPTDKQIQAEMYRELAVTDGNMQKAWLNLSHEKDTLDGLETRDLPTRRRMYLLKATIGTILDSEHFKDMTSIHPLWAHEENKDARNLLVSALKGLNG